MEAYKFEIIESIAVLVLFFVLRFIAKSAIDNVALRFNYQKPRTKLTQKLAKIILLFFSTSLLLIIWGVDHSELAFFISSLLTVLGIAFFAQWSLISNITASLIIFFNHPANIGDTISIIDKDFEIEGKISDIGIFFITLKDGNGKIVTVPNNVFIQKMIRKNGKN